MEVKNGLLT